MKNIAIIYGSSTDNTKNVARKIAKKLSAENVLLKDVSTVDFSDLANCSNIILGTSTWGLGDLQDDWNSRIPELQKVDLTGKTLAFFGLGDSSSYSDTFADGMGLLYEAIEGKGFKHVGETSTDGYSFDSSVAVKNGKFIGLALDEDNESNLTEQRLNAWIESIIPELQ
ncbi:MAG: flavodoxin [Prevotellaceae bacterium]|jgi:flavodoxin I|nr:flavodoxin [Prevotellaceae bacterium]